MYARIITRSNYEYLRFKHEEIIYDEEEFDKFLLAPVKNFLHNIGYTKMIIDVPCKTFIINLIPKEDREEEDIDG